MGENNKQFDEEEILAKIAESAKETEIPDSLKPEAVKDRLKGKKKIRRKAYYRSFAAAAAALVIVVGGVGAMQAGRNADLQDKGNVHKYESGSSANGSGSSADGSGGSENGSSESANGTGSSVNGSSGSADGTGSSVNGSSGSADGTGGGVSGEVTDVTVEEDPVILPEKRKKVGDAYHLAEDYKEIYQVYRSRKNDMIKDAVVKGAVSGVTSDGISNGVENKYASDEDQMAEDSAAGSSSAEADSGSGNDRDYSKTNLMEEGVDESDIIKTDGTYIYTCKDNEINIVDISDSRMKAAGIIKPEIGDMGTIREIYVDGDRLYIIAEILDYSESEKKAEISSMDCIALSEDADVMLLTYDITDRTKPKLLGKVEQEGSYHTSRKVGGYIYLFTEKFIYGAESKKDLIPTVNEKKVAADCIYLPGTEASQELIVSSLNIKKPAESMDQLVVLNNYAQVYMSTESIYLYGSDWSSERTVTKIAKFSYKNGVLNGEDSVLVKGSVEEAFAIHESDGCLQVLTTDWNSRVTKNQLYLYNEKMKLTGKLEEIAAGEEIYAARYIGDIVYFITYHNTDPLFAVDLSDRSNPKMLGHVKITGFSDYLHPYGENLLLGIGYETDTETSEKLGVKLVMFDISKPTKLKIKDTLILKGADYTTAADEYKAVLANADKNVIGFMAEDMKEYNDDDGEWAGTKSEYSYNLYRWANGKFDRLFVKKISKKESDYISYIRGLYSGNRFYLMTRNSIDGKYHVRSYDMEKNYKAVDEIEF